MTTGRILVVDDLPDVRDTITGILVDEGYDVQAVANFEAALELLQTTRIHVAILDVRLDETDVENEAGLQLMHDIRHLDPTIATIIMTGHAHVDMVQAALHPDKHGKSPAFSFLQKSEIKQLPAVVRQAFDQVVRISRSLSIQDQGQVIPQLARRLRFEALEKPPKNSLIEEIDELLRKLFYPCERIMIEAPQRGYSAAAVFKVIPWYPERGEGEALIVKIGERDVLDEEVVRYNSYVAGMVGGHRVPKGINTVQTRSLTGILYSFAGLGAARDFSDFFANADAETIQTAIRNLYLSTCRPWQREATPSSQPIHLRNFYFEHLWLNDRGLERAFENTMGGRHPFDLAEEGQIRLGEEILLTNPLALLQSYEWQHSVLWGIIHGDLQGYNVLVDHYQETWLIDFASTSRGPLAQDYAMFEVYFLVSAITFPNWQKLYQWQQLLFDAPNLTAVPLPYELAQVHELRKAHAAVLTIRRLAFGDAVYLSEQEYLAALLFNALKLITIMNLPAVQRDYALIASALVAKRLASLST